MPSLTLLVRSICLVGLMSLASCASLVKPGEAPIRPYQKTSSPVGIAVTDHRTKVSGGSRKDRYYGRCRLVWHGIPSSILDPKSTSSDRLTEHLKAGFEEKGMSVVTRSVPKFTSNGEIVSGFQGSGVKKILVVRLDNVWMDFANPLLGNDSLMYFNASAQVLSPSGKVLGSTTKSFEKDFRYDVNDSLFNQAVKVLQPEFESLINDSKVRRALAP